MAMQKKVITSHSRSGTKHQTLQRLQRIIGLIQSQHYTENERHLPVSTTNQPTNPPTIFFKVVFKC